MDVGVKSPTKHTIRDEMKRLNDDPEPLATN